MSNERALAVIEGEFRDIEPVASPSDAKRAMAAYQEMASAIMEPDDFQTFMQGGKQHKFRKRSGWKKLERFYGVSIEVKEERIFHEHQPAKCLRVKMPDHFKDVIDCGCPIKGVRYVVRAVDVRTGRYSENVGIATTGEARIPASASLHDLATRALNRGANRATADLIGVSDPSADERAAEKGISKEAAGALAAKYRAADAKQKALAVEAMRTFLNRAPEKDDDRAVYIAFINVVTEDALPGIFAILDPVTSPEAAADEGDIPFPAEPEPAKAT